MRRHKVFREDQESFASFESCEGGVLALRRML